MGTIDRSDDTIAGFSSRGPTAIDRGAKPDLVAPGVGIESLSDPAEHALSARDAVPAERHGARRNIAPYLSLSGTSQAAPVVAGTVALMLQANPTLTPNAVKAILQYTAEARPEYDALTQGAGFLNAAGAVELARHLAAPATTAYPTAPDWSAHLIWGNQRVRDGRLMLAANGWSTGVTWGAVVDACRLERGVGRDLHRVVVRSASRMDGVADELRGPGVRDRPLGRRSLGERRLGTSLWGR